MTEHETEEFSANMHLALFMEEVAPKLMPKLMEDERFANLRVDGKELTEGQASELVRHILFSCMNQGAGDLLGAVVMAPYSQLATLMSAACDKHRPRLADQMVENIPRGGHELGWSTRELKHLQTLCREFVNATKRLAPLILRMEHDAAEQIRKEATMRGEA